jgi:hypothetical protein
MSQSEFKGQIQSGRISASFQSDFSNIDSDLLIQSYKPTPSGSGLLDRKAVAPGGAVTTQFTTPKAGVLDIFVVTGHEEESGRLVVRSGNTTLHDEAVQGAVRWMYMVV